MKSLKVLALILLISPTVPLHASELSDESIFVNVQFGQHYLDISDAKRMEDNNHATGMPSRYAADFIVLHGQIPISSELAIIAEHAFGAALFDLDRSSVRVTSASDYKTSVTDASMNYFGVGLQLEFIENWAFQALPKYYRYDHYVTYERIDFSGDPKGRHLIFHNEGIGMDFNLVTSLGNKSSVQIGLQTFPGDHSRFKSTDHSLAYAGYSAPKMRYGYSLSYVWKSSSEDYSGFYPLLTGIGIFVLQPRLLK